MCFGDRFNNRNSNRELHSTKKEGDTHVILQSDNLCEGRPIERVIINHLPIHEIASHWALHSVELCNNLFTFQVV